MKIKLLIITILCFLLTGCYNYTNLSDLGIISTVTIDYKDNTYEIILEMRENKKDETNKSVIYKGKGISLDKAIQCVALKMNKMPFFIDLDVLIISFNAANNKLDSIIDYITRENNFSFNFNILLADNPSEIIKTFKKKDIVVGDGIKNILDSKFNPTVNINCEEFLENYLNKYYNTILPIITIDDEEIVIENAALFSNKKIVKTIDLKQISIYNMLQNNDTLFLFDIKFDNKQIVYKTFITKIKIDYKDNKLTVTGIINGSLDEMDKVNINDKKVIKNIKKIIKKEITNEIELFIDDCIKYNTDPLGLKKIIYNKTKNKNIEMSDIKYTVNPTIIIDRKGLIFNSIGEYYAEK